MRYSTCYSFALNLSIRVGVHYYSVSSCNSYVFNTLGCQTIIEETFEVKMSGKIVGYDILCDGVVRV